MVNKKLLALAHMLIVLFIFLVFISPMTVLAKGTQLTTFLVPYDSYTYDYWERPVPAPHAYLPSFVISPKDIGVDKFSGANDFFVSSSGEIYLADTGNNRIILIDNEWQVSNIIANFDNNGVIDTFNRPRGVYVTPGGDLYVADTNNARIVKLNSNGELIKVFDAPHIGFEDLFPDNFIYRPTKVGVNNNGHLFVISQDFFEGFITMDASGIFRGVIGAPRVIPTLADYIWSLIATREQRERQSLFLPTEYSNFSMDEIGFLYATVVSEEGDFIRRLNPAGADSLKREGFHKPKGDLKHADQWSQATFKGVSSFRDITNHPNGVYSALDGTRGRVFTYDENGNLLFVFGFRGRDIGQVANSVAIQSHGRDIYVLDGELGEIVVFKPTEYANLIWDAIEEYSKGNHYQTEQIWRKVLTLNANYDLAYTGIGRSLLLQKEYNEAMYHFKLGNNRKGYSDAFRRQRELVLKEHFSKVMTGLLVLGLGLAAISIYRSRTRPSEFQAAVSSEQLWLDARAGSGWRATIMTTVYSLKYAFYVIFHPFDGYWELKHEKRGTLSAAFIILGLLAATYVGMRQYTGFIFNHRDLAKLNVVTELLSILVPFCLWVGVNWALTTLMDGKGTLNDIIIASAYSLVPILLIYAPLTFVSNYLSLDEGSFYYLFLTFAAIWSAFLMFFGAIVTTHDYSVSKAILTTIFTLMGMIFSLFLGALFFNLLEQVTLFTKEIFTELMYRS